MRTKGLTRFPKMQYAHTKKERKSAELSSYHPLIPRSKYHPHQGTKELNRRATFYYREHNVGN